MTSQNREKSITLLKNLEDPNQYTPSSTMKKEKEKQINMPTRRKKKHKKNVIGRTIVLLSIGLCLSIYKQLLKQFYQLNNNQQHEDESRLQNQMIHPSFLHSKENQKRHRRRQQQQILNQRGHQVVRRDGDGDDDDDDDTMMKATKTKTKATTTSNSVVIQKLLHYINNNNHRRKINITSSTTTTKSNYNYNCLEINHILKMFQQHNLPTRMELPQSKYNVLHIGKSGGGSIITRLALNWKLQIFSIHPIPPNKRYFYITTKKAKTQSQSQPQIPLTLITIRDPIDRAVSAYYWRSLVLCNPYNNINNETRPIGEATKDPTKFCKLSKRQTEIDVLFSNTKYEQRNINDIAEKLCNNNDSEEASKDFKQIQHLEHKLTGGGGGGGGSSSDVGKEETNPWLPFWLFNNGTQQQSERRRRNNYNNKKQKQKQNNNDFIIKRIYPIVMERPYTIEKQIDLAIEWFYENEKFESSQEFELRRHYSNLLDIFLQQCSSSSSDNNNSTSTSNGNGGGADDNYGNKNTAGGASAAAATGGGAAAAATIIENDDDVYVEGQQQQQQQRRRRRLDENNNGEGGDDYDNTTTANSIQGGPKNIKQKISSFFKNNRDRGGGGGGGGGGGEGRGYQRKQPPNNNKNKPSINMVEYQKRHKHSSVIHMPNQTKLSSIGEKCLMEYYQQDYEALLEMSTKKYIWCKTMECQIAIDTIMSKRLNLLNYYHHLRRNQKSTTN